jgi:hypothetical protein
LRKRLQSGETSAHGVLIHFRDNRNDAPIGGARVRWLLMSLPGINGAFADYILDTLGIEHTRRIRGLGRNQLAALIAEFAPDKRRG